jgi:hypothetical protein
VIRLLSLRLRQLLEDRRILDARVSRGLRRPPLINDNSRSESVIASLSAPAATVTTKPLLRQPVVVPNKQPVITPDTYYCSHLVADLLIKAGILHGDRADSSSYIPADFSSATWMQTLRLDADYAFTPDIEIEVCGCVYSICLE